MDTVSENRSFDALFEGVYQELRRLAHHQRTPGDGATLDTTALVHEVYVQMRRSNPEFAQTRQFYAYAARAMRHLLIDRARERARTKHGGDLHRVEWDEALLGGVHFAPEQALELDAALRQLADEDARAAEVVELHYFAGLSMEDIAGLLGCSARTVFRDWRFARAFLYAQLGGEARLMA